MKRVDKVYNQLRKICIDQYNNKGESVGSSAIEIAKALNLQRTNVSSELNKLWREGKVDRIDGKPVLYKIKYADINTNLTQKSAKDVFNTMIGFDQSLKNVVQQAKAAIIYPPRGLHTLLNGETGTGKSMFAELMYKYAKQINRIKVDAPFVTFNCADYANNPQLLMSQLFGVKKGTYTGAYKDKPGIVEKSDGGVLFLDEVHRLPSEGQEMLFYLIDKGLYKKLGETEEHNKANVLIICATTENIKSVLLKTFIRRIPMIIKLPTLKDRTFKERYEIIKNFFIIEASNIKADIIVTPNSFRALMLYDCPNNIGQLKSDIKLCCAKAFLSFMMKRDKNVCIHTQDLPEYVRKGLFKYKEYKDNIDQYVNGDYISFSADKNGVEFREDKNISNFYEALEEKKDILKSNGLSEKDIKLIMGLDIETYIKKYVHNIKKDSLDNLYKIVDKRIVDIVEEFLDYADKKTCRQFSSKILYGLSIHISSSVERIIKHKKIENHQLDEIKKLHNNEYNIAKYLGDKIEKEFNIAVPDDEIGFIAMFLYIDDEPEDNNERVAIIIAMHGESAATSIANVVNKLLGNEFTIGYNMPLEQKSETALENLIEITKMVNKGQGVLFLIDMGSLALFGDMIYERTGIPIKTIDMVSTPIALEAARKALLNATLEEVYNSTINLSPYVGRIYKDSFNFNGGVKNNVIITACITGMGTANKLKMILEQKFDLPINNIDIIPIDIPSKAEFKKKIDKVKSEKNVLAVVSAIDLNDSSILYISTSDIFDKYKLPILKRKIGSIDKLLLISNMQNVIKESTSLDSYKYIEAFKEFYLLLFSKGVDFNNDNLIGIILHIACAIECVLDGKDLIHIKNVERVISDNSQVFTTIRNALKPLETSFSITISGLCQVFCVNSKI